MLLIMIFIYSNDSIVSISFHEFDESAPLPSERETSSSTKPAIESNDQPTDSNSRPKHPFELVIDAKMPIEALPTNPNKKSEIEV